MSKKPIIFLFAALTIMSIIGCTTSQTLNLGYVQDENTISLVNAGSSRDQVLLALGTPSTITNADNETFYYISQTKTKSYAFQKGKIVDQRILAIYFDENQLVVRKANFGLKDGKVFDFISRTTPSGGKDLSFLGQALGAIGNITR